MTKEVCGLYSGFSQDRKCALLSGKYEPVKITKIAALLWEKLAMWRGVAQANRMETRCLLLAKQAENKE